MFAAMLGAISATDRPTAAQMDSPRFSPNTGYPSAAWPGSPDPAVGDGVAAICSSSAVLRSHSVPPTEADTEGAKDTKTSTPPGMYGARGPYLRGSGATSTVLRALVPSTAYGHGLSWSIRASWLIWGTGVACPSCEMAGRVGLFPVAGAECRSGWVQ